MLAVSTMAQNLDTVLRLLLGLIILTFPMILPVLFSCLFTGKEGEGISNEDIWILEIRANRARDRLAFCTSFVHCTFLHILASNPGFTDTLNRWGLTHFYYLQIIELRWDTSNGMQQYTYRITQSVTYVNVAS